MSLVVGIPYFDASWPDLPVERTASVHSRGGMHDACNIGMLWVLVLDGISEDDPNLGTWCFMSSIG